MRTSDEIGRQRGRSYTIEKSSAIANVLNDELKGLVATVARNLQLVIKPVRGVRVLKVFGYPTQQNGSAVTSSIGFMGGSQSREVLVRVAIDTGIIGTSLTKLGLVEMRYDDVKSDGEKRQSEVMISVGLATSVEEQNATENTDVKVRVAELETAAKLEIAARAVQKGNYGAARQTIRGALGLLRKENAARPSRRLRQQIQTFEEAEEEMQAAPASVSAKKSFSKKFKARAYQQNKN